MCNNARSQGITGVPMTIIDDKWAVSGGQSSDVFIQVCSREFLSSPMAPLITILPSACLVAMQIFKKLAAAGVHNAPSPFPGHIVDTLIVA